jgi:hypothetical protein
MEGVALIRFRDGMLLMPAYQGYDRELAFEEAKFCAQRYGEARLELDHCETVVRSAGRDPALTCTRCTQAAPVAFAWGDSWLCLRCARELVN